MFTVIDSSLYGFITNKHDDQLPVGSLAQLDKHFIIMQDMKGKINEYLRVTLWPYHY